MTSENNKVIHYLYSYFHNKSSIGDSHFVAINMKYKFSCRCILNMIKRSLFSFVFIFYLSMYVFMYLCMYFSMYLLFWGWGDVQGYSSSL